MKRILVLLCAVLLALYGCGGEAPGASGEVSVTMTSEKSEKLVYNSETLWDNLGLFLDTAAPDDEVTINVWINRENFDDLKIKQKIEEGGLPVQICNAIENRDYELTDPYAKKRYENMHNYYGAPTFEENIDAARRSLEDRYQELKAEATEEYYRDIIADMPFRGEVEYEDSITMIHGYVATAEEVCELSFHERVFNIMVRDETPVVAPERIRSAVTFTELCGDLQVSVSFDKEAYAYGDTVNMQIMIYNGGDSGIVFTPVNVTGNTGVGGDNLVSGFYYIESGFFADGVARRDISCNYGYDMANAVVTPDMELLPGETMGKTYAFTPHKTYEFMGTPVDADSEWVIKTEFEVYENGEPVKYELETPVLRAD